KTDILSKISHELRAPLTSVLGYVELLGDEVEAPAGRRMLSVVERNAKRLLGLIDDLLTMSLVDAGIMEIDATIVDVELVVKHVCDTLDPVVSKTGLEIALDLAPNLKITADRDKVERALLNLVSNAVKFTPPSGRICITSRATDTDVEIAVRDTGCGVPAEEQQHLFTRFFRAAHAQSEQVPGVGLGLFIVKQIVDLHHGSVSVESTEQGSTFIMRLPAALAAA
ncbi:MAG TPA: HAMP domain-containing sensor histidine kinase, partial [Candidatus Elarobacter sp.]|nr:HAMP domain-containing sensor histidine kinase [Candidatus Elarobacter sp.]